LGATVKPAGTPPRDKKGSQRKKRGKFDSTVEKWELIVVNFLNLQAPRGIKDPLSGRSGEKEDEGVMGELKSASELAMDKAKKMGGEEVASFSSNQKKEIAEIRKIYEAKIAEVEILVQDKEKREIDIERLKRERDRKIESVYAQARGR
jgi:hypothetical protein